MYWTERHYYQDEDTLRDFPNRKPLFTNLTNIGNHTFIEEDRYIIPDYIEVETTTRDEALNKNIGLYQKWNLYGIIISSAMLWYIICKLIFNQFAVIKCPYDMWTYIDVFCGITNITCFILLMNLKSKDILDIANNGVKRTYNNLMCLTVIATWSRVTGMYYVIEKYAKLLITIQKMMGSAKTFFFILFLYFAIMGVIAQALFQEYNITYSNT